jgi:hypothetical protein
MENIPSQQRNNVVRSFKLLRCRYSLCGGHMDKAMAYGRRSRTIYITMGKSLLSNWNMWLPGVTHGLVFILDPKKRLN